MRTARTRRGLFSEQKGKCALCGGQMSLVVSSENYATFDHIVPVSCGGTDRKENLRLAHAECNVKRGAVVSAAERKVLTRRQRLVLARAGILS